MRNPYGLIWFILKRNSRCRIMATHRMATSQSFMSKTAIWMWFWNSRRNCRRLVKRFAAVPPRTACRQKRSLSIVDKSGVFRVRLRTAPRRSSVRTRCSKWRKHCRNQNRTLLDSSVIFFRKGAMPPCFRLKKTHA